MIKKTKVCLFIRVSKQQQEYDRQILELTRYCDSRGYTVTKTIATKITGVKKNEQRPDIQELFQAAKARQFDKVVVSEISRIGRNAREIRSTIDFLHDRGISIVFRNLGGLESLDDQGNESFTANIIIAIYSELAQEEKRLLSERVCSAIENARAEGKQIGRPKGSTMNKDKLLKKYPRLVEDLRAGLSIRKACKVYTVSEGTDIKLKRII